VVLAPSSAQSAGDPGLVWQTFTTKHFQVHHHKGLEKIAQRVAEICESVHVRLSPVLGWEPKSRTQVVVTDDTDFANGSATSLPFNIVRLFVTAPDDLSPLADYDDWLTELITHEYTHILHTDHITGLPAIYDAIFGKVYSPNQTQPRWIIEGLAVLQESVYTSGGRNRSSIFDMYLRADVLEDNIARIDQISHNPRRWPQGNLWYLYGSHFLEYIQSIYGPDALRSVAADYGAQIIPFGINRSIHRATGKTYIELYEGWKTWMKTRYAAQEAAVEARGVREGMRLTYNGQEAWHPRYFPSGALAPGQRKVAFFRNDGHTTSGIYALDPSAPKKQQLLTRTSGASSPAFLPDGSLVYDSVEVSKKVYAFWELFYRDKNDLDGDEAVQGERLTVALRANEPTVAPDGTHVAYVVNKQGTTYLYLSELVAGESTGTNTHALTVPKKLFASERFEQVYTPRWSPDGKRIAFSSWTDGGYRDIKIIDVASGIVTEVTHDRALDTGPVFSPDGKKLYFSSDRTGIANIYQYTPATGVVKQVTNVVNGAYQPDVSPDGEHLAYVGYTHEGYDLFELALDDAKLLDALDYVDTRGPRPPAPAHLDLKPTPYNPWPTLRPYTWSFAFKPDAFGDAITVTTQGGDVVGHHAFGLTIGASFEKGEPSIDFAYLYRRLPFDMRVHGYRYIAPRGGYRFGDKTPVWIEQTIGADTGIVIPFNRAFAAQNVALTYSFAQFRALDGFPKDVYDPYTRVPVFPQTGFIGALHLGYSWSNVQRFLWSVGAEKGFAFSVGIDYARRELASDFDLFVASYSAVGYFPMPWKRHHTLALHAQGAATAGDYARRGAFALGGYSDIPLPDAIRNLLFQPGIALRGYPPGAVYGDAYQLFNAEYRFPIVNVDHGVQTLPAFVERIYGNLLFDWGNATFDHLDLRDMKKGIGVEVLTDFTIGYFTPLTLRIGFAYGLNEGGIRPHRGEGLKSIMGQNYIVLSSLF
jgi:hypothetical protein